MDILKLKNLLNQKKYILIDFSEKFKIKNSQNVLLEIYKNFEMMEDKLKMHDNIVFLLDISKIAKYNNVLFQMLFAANEIPLSTDVLYLKHSDNFMWFKFGENIKDNIIFNFLNQKNKNYECNVCFEEYGSFGTNSSGGSYCGICDFRTCNKCYIEANKNNLNGSCFGCRTKCNNRFLMCQ